MVIISGDPNHRKTNELIVGTSPPRKFNMTMEKQPFWRCISYEGMQKLHAKIMMLARVSQQKLPGTSWNKFGATAVQESTNIIIHGKTTYENGDFPLTCWFSGGLMIKVANIPTIYNFLGSTLHPGFNRHHQDDLKHVLGDRESRTKRTKPSWMSLELPHPKQG